MTMAAVFAIFSADASACHPDAYDSASLPPFQRPVPGEIVKRVELQFHAFLNLKRNHLGLAFSIEKGEALVAAAGGEVISIGNEGQAGVAILIRHLDGWETFYAPLSRLAVQPGDCVKRGDVIGYARSSGLTEGDILYFEIRHNGMPLDPTRLLMKRAAQ